MNSVRNPSSSNQGGENSHHAEQNDAGLAAVGRDGFEVEEVEYGEALEGAAARDCEVAGLIAAGLLPQQCSTRSSNWRGRAGRKARRA